ncbi:MAG: hypothetical protein ACTSQE_02295 [Candidatus Heimdallarchaeaceae archaeon]
MNEQNGTTRSIKHEKAYNKKSEMADNVSFQSSLEDFRPQVETAGDYISSIFYGDIEEQNKTITLTEPGVYRINGNISNLESVLIQNPGAENAQPFYADSVSQTGLELERINDNTSYEGNYSWKFYSNNTSPLMYSSYQKDLTLYQDNITISYNYKFESNSTLQTILNSTVMFDFIFDTCRIIVYHWMYSDPPHSLLGANDTDTLPVTYNFLYNTSWDNQWYNFNLDLSHLLDESNSKKPTRLESIGFFISSPSYSECSFLIDNIQIKSQPTPEEINFQVNNITVNSTGANNAFFSLFKIIEEESEYNLTFSHNSSSRITGNYEFQIFGEVFVSYEKDISFSQENGIFYEIRYANICLDVHAINISYPLSWNLYDTINSSDLIITNAINIGLKTIYITWKNIHEFTLLFSIENAIQQVTINNTDIFEKLNGSFKFIDTLNISTIQMFWVGSETGKAEINVEDGIFNYKFQPSIFNGKYEIIFLYIEGDIIGYFSCTINLNRYPADLLVTDHLNIAQFGLRTIDVSYIGLDNNSEIKNPNIRAVINNEEIINAISCNNAEVPISAFYLIPGNYSIEIIASSQSHASVSKTVNLYVYESDINISFNYELRNNSLYELTFSLTSDTIAVGYAPILIEINNQTVISGITDICGKYTDYIKLPLNTTTTNLTCTVVKASHVLKSAHFTIECEILKVYSNRYNDEIIIDKNITLSYSIKYPDTNEKWFLPIETEMLPIIEAFIDAESYIIPVIWDEKGLYWQINANSSTQNHRLIIKTYGPKLSTSYDINEKGILVHFTIQSIGKGFTNLSLVFYWNDSIEALDYQWELINAEGRTLSETYPITITNLYVKINNINLISGTYLFFDLIGKLIKNGSSQKIWIPLVSGSFVISTFSFAGIKIYKKRKSLTIEI